MLESYAQIQAKIGKFLEVTQSEEGNKGSITFCFASFHNGLSKEQEILPSPQTKQRTLANDELNTWGLPQLLFTFPAGARGDEHWKCCRVWL